MVEGGLKEIEGKMEMGSYQKFMNPSIILEDSNENIREDSFRIIRSD